MSQNYKLVYDVHQLLDYYNCFRANVCGADDVNKCSVKIMLKARRKYNAATTQSKSTVVLLRRAFDLHNSANDFVQYMQRFQVVEGLYSDRDRKTGTTTPIPGEALVLYVTSNAMSRVEATKKIVKQVVNDALFCAAPPQLGRQDGGDGGGEDDDGDASGGSDVKPFFSLDKQYLTMLHKSPATKMQRLDVDTQDAEFIAQLDALLTKEKADVVFAIRTPNGYHYVVRSGPFMRAMVAFCATHSGKISYDNNGMNALPGMLQGGKPVQLVYAKGLARYNLLPSQRAMLAVQAQSNQCAEQDWNWGPAVASLLPLPLFVEAKDWVADNGVDTHHCATCHQEWIDCKCKPDEILPHLPSELETTIAAQSDE